MEFQNVTIDQVLHYLGSTFFVELEKSFCCPETLLANFGLQFSGKAQKETFDQRIHTFQLNW